MKTITLILPDYYDEAVTVIAVGQQKINKNHTAVKIHSATEHVENGQNKLITQLVELADKGCDDMEVRLCVHRRDNVLGGETNARIS